MESNSQIANLTLSHVPHVRKRSKVHIPKFSTVSASGYLDVSSVAKGELRKIVVTAAACMLLRYGNEGSATLVLTGGALGSRLKALTVDDGMSVADLSKKIASNLDNLNGLRDLEPEVAQRGCVTMHLTGGGTTEAIGDISVHFETDDGSLALTYDTRLISAMASEQILDHLVSWCRVVECNSAQLVPEVMYLGAEERNNLRQLSDGGAPAFLGTLWELYQAALAEHSATLALEIDGHEVTLAKLDRLAERISANLRRLGVSGGARVGIAIAPSELQIATLIACLKLGATWVPLDVSLPRKRLDEICSDASPAVFVCDRSAYAIFEGKGLVVEVATLTKDTGVTDSYETCASDKDDPLYLLFTSGSTGRAKGVVVPHRTLANLVMHENNIRPVAGKRVLGRTSIAFDVGLQEIFSTILFGGTLVVLSQDQRTDVAELPSILSQLDIGKVFLPPVALYQLCAAQASNPAVLDNLKHVIVAGERLVTGPSLKRFFRSISARLVNQYGPTETHVATEYCLSDRPLSWDEHPSIGRPLPGVKVFVVDQNDSPVPLLTSGEIVVGGVATGLGYVGSGEGRQDAFRKLNDGRVNHDVYHTGDRANWTPDGSLTFVGRKDNQVKIRGYRVELEDLEVNARNLPVVADAVARVWQSKSFEGLALYLKVHGSAAISSRDVRRMLESKVPSFMLPALPGIVMLSELPVTSTGKVDRAALPCPSDLHPDVSTQTQAPASIHERILSIWQEYLKVAEISPDDQFADLGGDSLMAIQIASEVNDTFGVSVPLTTLLKGASLGGFTAIVERIQQDSQEIARATRGDDPIGDRADLIGDVKSDLQLVRLKPGQESGEVLINTISRHEALHLWQEIYEDNAYLVDKGMFGQSPTIVDIGANIGIFSRYILDLITDSRVFSVEPIPELVDCLRSNLSEFGERAKILNCACGSKSQHSAEITFFPNVPAMSSRYPDIEKEARLLRSLLNNSRPLSASNDHDYGQETLEDLFVARSQSSKLITVSDIIDQHSIEAIDLLKIDVQRGEDTILDGIGSEDWTKIRNVVIEMQDDGQSLVKIRRRLEEHGFHVEVKQAAIHLQTNVSYVSARKLKAA